ncbi:MAG: MATE family efflux transporter [Planctomycetota bacterium]
MLRFFSRPARSEFRRIWLLSLPVIVAQVSTMMLGVVDMYMLGQLGASELAGAVLGNVWVHGTLIMGLGLLMGMDPVVTQAHGRRDTIALGHALQRGLVLALLASVPLFLAWQSPEWILELMGQNPEVIALSKRYTSEQSFSIPFFLCFSTFRQFLQGRGIVWPVMCVAIVANVFNYVANDVLIFGKLCGFDLASVGVEGVGFDGAAWATGATRCALFAAVLGLVLWKRLGEGAWVPWSRETFRMREFRRLVGYGVPVAFQFGLEVWAFQIAVLWAGQLGTIPLAAHGIVLNTASLTFMMPLGVSLGAVTRVGNLIGEGRFERAQLAAWVAILIGIAIMLASAIGFVVLRDQIPAAFSPKDAGVIAAAAAVFPIAGAFQLFDGAQVVGGGILRGMGRTVPAGVFNLVGYYVIALPVAWWMTFRLGLGLSGIWWGSCIGLGIVAVLLFIWISMRGPRTMRGRV